MQKIIALLVIINGFASFEGKLLASSVQVTLYYETLCPDCRQFISYQLNDTYTSLGSRFLKLEMVPYGFAKEINGSFFCQHGPTECYGNKLHGCVLQHFDIDSSMKFIECCGSQFTSNQIQLCSQKANIQFSTIKECLINGEADNIFRKNGEKTKAAAPQSVPHLVFNGVYDKNTENEALQDLMKVTCKFLNNEPKQCQGEEPEAYVDII